MYCPKQNVYSSEDWFHDRLKTHKRLKERLLIRRNRTKRANNILKQTDDEFLNEKALLPLSGVLNESELNNISILFWGGGGSGLHSLH